MDWMGITAFVTALAGLIGVMVTGYLKIMAALKENTIATKAAVQSSDENYVAIGKIEEKADIAASSATKAELAAVTSTKEIKEVIREKR